MKDANKPFTIFMGLMVITGIIAGLCLRLEWMGAAGIFVALSSVLFIYALSWGFYPKPVNVRKRNTLKIVMLLAFHIMAFFVVGGSKEFVAALNTNNATKSIETFSKTYSTFGALKDVGLSILKFESVNFERVLWVYVIWSIGFGIGIYKVLRSWGWPCVLTAGSATGITILLINFWAFFVMPWNWVCIGLIVLLGMLTLYFGKQTYHTPAIA